MAYGRCKKNYNMALSQIATACKQKNVNEIFNYCDVMGAVGASSMAINKQFLKFPPRLCYKYYSNVAKNKVDSSAPASSESAFKTEGQEVHEICCLLFWMTGHGCCVYSSTPGVPTLFRLASYF